MGKCVAIPEHEQISKPVLHELKNLGCTEIFFGAIGVLELPSVQKELDRFTTYIFAKIIFGRARPNGVDLYAPVHTFISTHIQRFSLKAKLEKSEFMSAEDLF